MYTLRRAPRTFPKRRRDSPACKQFSKTQPDSAQSAATMRRGIQPHVFEPDEIASNLLLTIDGADEYIFGMLSSTMFITWLGGVGGRLESRFRVSAEVVYNNFPFPKVSDAEMSRVVNAAKDVLTAREEYPTASLADLYNPAAMPESLVRAHIALDRAVDGTFGKGVFPTVSSRLAELLEQYANLVEPANLLTELPVKKTRKKKLD